jgi:hypothetical protein
MYFSSQQFYIGITTIPDLRLASLYISLVIKISFDKQKGFLYIIQKQKLFSRKLNQINLEEGNNGSKTLASSL